MFFYDGKKKEGGLGLLICPKKRGSKKKGGNQFLRIGKKETTNNKGDMFSVKGDSSVMMVLFLMYGISVKSWGGERKVRKRKRFSNLSLSLDFFPI